jgi:hypothetical protein
MKESEKGSGVLEKARSIYALRFSDPAGFKKGEPGALKARQIDASEIVDMSEVSDVS